MRRVAFTLPIPGSDSSTLTTRSFASIVPGIVLPVGLFEQLLE